MTPSNLGFHTMDTNTASAATLPRADDSREPDASLLLASEVAFNYLRHEIEAVPDSQLSTVNLDMSAAIATATGAWPQIQSRRDQIAASLPDFNLEQFDKLGQYTLALTHAHARYRKSFAPKEDLSNQADELEEVRDHMMANAASLAKMRLINGEQLKLVKTIPGYRALAMDVLTLCSMFSDDWDKVQGKTPFTKEELHRVGTLALQLLQAVGLREQGPVTTGDATVLRQKAFTLFLRAYDQARRAVHYLRNDEGDAEDIAPSLYMNRTRRRADGAQEGKAPGASPVTPGSNQARSATPAPPLVIDNPAGYPVVGSPLI